MFDWNDLRYLLAVARTGSTLAAARILAVNQTTVARRLEALEAALAVRLVERGQTGSRLTQAGTDLIPAAESIELAAVGIIDRAAAQARGMAGVVRVTTNEPTANIGVMPVLGEFRRLFPQIRVEMIVTDRHLDVLKGEADVAIRGTRTITEPDLVVRRITDIPWAIYASRAYIAQHGRPLGPEDLRRHLLIGGDEQVAVIDSVRWMLWHAPEAEVVCRSNTLSNLLQAVKAGLGLGPLPCLIGSTEPDLILCFPAPAEFTDGLWLITAPELKNAPRVRAFLDFIAPNIIARLKVFQDQAALRSAADG